MRSLRFVLAACVLFAAPISAQGPATVCKDGSSSTTTGRGACSGHNGVDAKATAAAAKAAKAAAKAAKSATKDAKDAAKNAGKVAAKKADAAKEEMKSEKASDKAALTQVACKDGSKSAGGRGACSGHGGIAVSNPVQRQADKQESKAAKVEAKSDKAQMKAGNGSREDNNPVGSIAKCKDGMYSHAANRRGACSRHGGVASWT